MDDETEKALREELANGRAELEQLRVTCHRLWAELKAAEAGKTAGTARASVAPSGSRFGLRRLKAPWRK